MDIYELVMWKTSDRDNTPGKGQLESLQDELTHTREILARLIAKLVEKRLLPVDEIESITGGY